MELCSVCIFEHRKATSISGLECDSEICYGSRNQNSFNPKPEQEEIEIAFTKSDDGKTCNFCGSELVIKETKGDVVRKVKTCPLPTSECRPVKKFDLKLFIDKNRETVNNTPEDQVFTINCRNIDLTEVQKMVELNQDRLVTAPNEQATEIKIVMDTVFEGAELKKEGKTFSFIMCKDGWETEEINRVSDNYKLIRVQKIGKINYKYSCNCNYHRAKLGQILSPLREKYQHDDNYNWDNIKSVETEKFYQKIDFIKVTLQRINTPVDKELADYFFNKRFVKLARNPERADDFFLNFIDRLDADGKRWILGRCKVLGIKEEIEVQVRSHEFADYRYDKTNRGLYVGEARTLNWYRARDDFAVYLTSAEFSDFRHKKYEAKNIYTIPPTLTFAGIQKSEEHMKKDKEEYHQCFVRFARQFGVDSDEILISSWDGQVFIASPFAFTNRHGSYQIKKRESKN
jgi:hypothetical protein